jgi:hypothetical protein
MNRIIVGAVFLSLFLISVGYAKDNSQVNEDSNGTIESIYTDLSRKACTEVPDVDDPNETPYQLCPGAAGYALIKRNADGRQSIDVVTPKKKKVPLDYWDFVTRRFSHLGDKAEWRVTRKNGRLAPVALIVRVQAHENDQTPEEVTHSYAAVAKITPKEICVTDRILVDTLSESKVRQAADSANTKKCLAPQPRLITDGVIVR